MLYSFARTGRTIKIKNGISGAPCVQMAHEWVRQFERERETEGERESESELERPCTKTPRRYF